jgi:hypothetical protein
LEQQSCWSGTSSELLTALEADVTDQIKRQKSWPKNGRSMSGHLKRLAPNLRSAGWEIAFQREAKRRWVSIERTDASSTGPIETVQPDAKRGDPVRTDANDENDAIDGEPEWEEGQL